MSRTRGGIAAAVLQLAVASVAIAAGGAAGAPVADSTAAMPSGRELEAAGAVIGRIVVRPGEIFDTTIKGERGWVYRTANRLHIETRESVIREQLLFHSGEPYRDRLVRETERILRANDYLYEATVVPVAWDGHTVDLEVRTRDNWTLNPGINFNRKGGQNTAAVQLEEKNLLGTGKQLVLDWGKDYDRTSLTFQYVDPHFFSTWTQFAVSYSDASDGQTKALDLERPFYALDTRHAGGTNFLDSLRNDPRYVLGHQVGEFQHHEENYLLYGGWSPGWRQGWVTRWTYGASFERDRFAALPDVPLGGPLPQDRTLVYPWLGIEIIQDRYQERMNQDQIERTEDVLVGLRAGGRVGFASTGLGSDRDALVLSAYAHDGFDLRPGRSLFVGAKASGRIESGELRNGILSAEARYYQRTSRKTKFFATANGTVTEQLDDETQLLLGGDNGLRGYPLRYQAGTAAALLTLEERYYTDWYPFRLFHVAGAVFYDMGRTWGRDVTGATSAGLLRDVGLGLRLGSSRSAFGNVLHVDLAFPLDGDSSIDNVQLIIETKSRF